MSGEPRARIDESGRDPTDFIAEVDDLRVRLEDMGEQVSDDLIEDIILRDLPKEYHRIRQQSHSDRAFDLQKIKYTGVNMFIDEFSRNRSSDPTVCLLYTSPSPRDGLLSRMPSSA